MRKIQKYILEKTCPYCGSEEIIFGTQEEYYGRTFSGAMLYWCNICKASVGCHKSTKIPLGSLADKELKEMRHEIHEIIDKWWKTSKERKTLYKKLSKIFKVKTGNFHIGWLNNKEAKEILCTLKKKIIY